MNPKTGEIMWRCDIETDAVRRLIEVLSPYDYELIVDDEGIGNGSLPRDRVGLNRANVMYLMQTAKQTGDIMHKLSEISSITASEVPSWAGDSVDIHITNKIATKEHAVAELLKMLNISKEETIGVGDGNNDIHLFRAVGLKVAMGNATNQLKSKADVVCDTVENDGLAKFIEKLMEA